MYVTYIATTPEKAWRALIETDLMREWWVDPVAGCARVNVSDWKPGSRWAHTRADGTGTIDIVGKVVETTPPRRLMFNGISGGWPKVLSNLKTFLETGRPLPHAPAA